ncbi:MAG: hypothetical protein RSC57_02140 [Bacilli bacterium]
MPYKTLAYLKIKIKNDLNIFKETYTFLSPTVLYLPNDLILNIKKIYINKICIEIIHKDICIKKVILTICKKPCKKITIPCQCGNIILYLNLLAINTLKPCYRRCIPVCNDYYNPCK